MLFFYTMSSIAYSATTRVILLQCSDGLNNKVSNIIRKLMDNTNYCIYVRVRILRVLLSQSFIFFRFYFLSMYIWFYSCL